MLNDDELFADIARRKALGQDYKRPLGELVFRWRDASTTVIRRVQGAFMRGSPDDADEIFQDAVAKFMAKGLDQFRGVSEQVPGKAASPKTFFLRIVKHCAIDRYRRQREELDSGKNVGEDGDEPETSLPEAHRSIAEAKAVADQQEAHGEYWAGVGTAQGGAPQRGRCVGSVPSPGSRRSRGGRPGPGDHRGQFLQACEPRAGVAEALHPRSAQA